MQSHGGGGRWCGCGSLGGFSEENFLLFRSSRKQGPLLSVRREQMSLARGEDEERCN